MQSSLVGNWLKHDWNSSTPWCFLARASWYLTFLLQCAEFTWWQYHSDSESKWYHKKRSIVKRRDGTGDSQEDSKDQHTSLSSDLYVGAHLHVSTCRSMHTYTYTCAHTHFLLKQSIKQPLHKNLLKWIDACYYYDSLWWFRVIVRSISYLCLIHTVLGVKAGMASVMSLKNMPMVNNLSLCLAPFFLRFCLLVCKLFSLFPCWP